MNIQIHILLTIYTSKFQQRFYFNQIHKESKPTMEVITFKVIRVPAHTFHISIIENVKRSHQNLK